MLVRIVPLSVIRAPSFRASIHTTTSLTRGGGDPDPAVRVRAAGRGRAPAETPGLRAQQAGAAGGGSAAENAAGPSGALDAWARHRDDDGRRAGGGRLFPWSCAGGNGGATILPTLSRPH